MAIGSSAEIGTVFSRVGDYPSFDAVLAWHEAWRNYVGGDLLGGYATLVYRSERTDNVVDLFHAD